MKRYGLIGRGIGHSFSAQYFNEKFAREGIDAVYSNHDLPDISLLPHILEANPDIRGLNVTSPYKRSVIPFLDSLSEEAASLQAVNVIDITLSPEGKRILKGYNTDAAGFHMTLPDSGTIPLKAAVLGTGGAASAVSYALTTVSIHHVLVSRNPGGSIISYEELNRRLREFNFIINATPLGMYPEVNDSPPLDFDKIDNAFVCYDLIYNPAETLFLKKASDRGAKCINGLDMLINQAALSWNIWNK